MYSKKALCNSAKLTHKQLAAAFVTSRIGQWIGLVHCRVVWHVHDCVADELNLTF